MGDMGKNQQRALRRGELGAAAQMCARAFRTAPHVKHFFPDRHRRDVDAAALFRMRIRYGLRFGEVHVSSPKLEGIAVWIPSEHATMTMWKQIRSGGIGLFRTVGAEAVARMTRVAEHNDRLRAQQMPGIHSFLAILAVDPEHQHRGHATRLLNAMLDRLDRTGTPCYAETTEQTLHPFYGRLGFEPQDGSTVSGTSLTVWPMVRCPRTKH